MSIPHTATEQAHAHDEPQAFDLPEIPEDMNPGLQRAGYVTAYVFKERPVVKLAIPTADGNVHRFVISLSNALEMVREIQTSLLRHYEFNHRPDRYLWRLQVAQSPRSDGSPSLDGSPVSDGQDV
jgi:hypothetical protein